MSKKLQAIRGMHDILPDKTPLWQRLEKAMAAVCHQYGYAEIRMPIVEANNTNSLALNLFWFAGLALVGR